MTDSFPYDANRAWQDHQYLFRLTSTFGWDDAVSLCEFLVGGIEAAALSAARRRRLRGAGRGDHPDEGGGNGEKHELAGSGGYGYFNDSLQGRAHGQQGKTLQEWMREAHAQLFYVDQWGNSPMHAACFTKPPAAVVEAMFRVGRALWEHSSYYRSSETPVWALPCKDGSTPFLVACSTGASTVVLHRYLDEVEYYIGRKWVDHPKSARTLVLQPDNQGTSPLVGWMNFHDRWIQRQLEESTRGGVPIQIMDVRREERSHALTEYWELACRILLFATRNIKPYGPPLLTPILLHRCAAIAMHCPVSLLEWIVAPRTSDEGWLPADLSAATPDNLGKLPMHRAMQAVDCSSIFDEEMVHHSDDFDTDTKQNASDNVSKFLAENNMTATMVVASETVCARDETRLFHNPKLEENRVKVIRKLLRWHPQAAATPFPNGRAPFVQAIAHGGTWHLMDYCVRDSDSDDNKGLLQVLWDYAPDQISEIDPVSGLYPFMLAATGPRSGFKRDQDMIDTVFCLLRKDPQLVSGALADQQLSCSF